MQAGLMKSRKQLTVETGPSAAELAAQKAESTPPEGTAFEHAEVAGESEVVRRFFQVCTYDAVLSHSSNDVAVNCRSDAIANTMPQ